MSQFAICNNGRAAFVVKENRHQNLEQIQCYRVAKTHRMP